MESLKGTFNKLLENNKDRNWNDSVFRKTMADAFRFNINNRVELLKERWKNQCEAMFGKDWNTSKNFKIFYNDFLEDIDQTFPNLNQHNKKG